MKKRWPPISGFHASSGTEQAKVAACTPGLMDARDHGAFSVRALFLLAEAMGMWDRIGLRFSPTSETMPTLTSTQERALNIAARKRGWDQATEALIRTEALLRLRRVNELD